MFTAARTTSTGVRTRWAKVEDVATLAALDAECFATRRWPEEAWREVVLHPAWRTLVAETDVGALAAAAVLLCQRPVSSLASLAVAPQWRGRGIGSSLLTQCIHLCRSVGARIVVLEVDEDNAPAVRLYHRLGFRTLRSFAEDGVARFEMVLVLGDADEGGRGARANSPPPPWYHQY